MREAVNTAQVLNMKKNRKIVRYPRALNINIGVIFFALIFIYLIFNVYAYVTAKHVTYYEVDEGSIRVRTSYTGLALREEQVIYANEGGYVNYYLKDNSRAKKGSLICSVDENGNIASQITDAGGADHSLDADAYRVLVEEMKDYMNTYTDMTFYESYTFKDDLRAELMEAVNLSALNSMSEYAQDAEAERTFHRMNAPEPGIVSYYYDGYEGVTVNSFTEEMLDESVYEKKNCKAAEAVEAGDPLYKLVTSEDWQLVFAIDDQVRVLLEDDSAINVRFRSDETTAWATYEILNRDDKTWLVLHFTNSLIRYASERFIDVELMLARQEGLKISNSSIVSKDFYVVPSTYFTHGGNSNSQGLLVETKNEDGETIKQFIATNIYYTADESYYVSEEGLAAGTKVINPAGGENLVLSAPESLQGVYNINKGYAVFRIIDILYQNEEYAIIARGTDYGLSQYDHIALDGSLVTEHEIITQ